MKPSRLIAVLLCALGASTGCQDPDAYQYRPPMGTAPTDSPRSAPPQRPPAPEALQEPIPLDAMVGQVNNKAVYANRVLAPLEPQLRALGQNLSPYQFQQEAERVIAQRLLGLVTNSLLLAEAERDLSQNEKRGLDIMLENYRQELLRRHGAGSPALAEKNLLRKEGLTLEQAVEERRQGLVINRYFQIKLNSQVNVTRQDVERYYRENREMFNPPATRRVRLLVAASPAAAEQIQERLDNGEPFIEVAADPGLNEFQPREAGLFTETGRGDVFADDTLNDALNGLEPGQVSQRLVSRDRATWVYLDSVDQPQSRSLEEVQLDIEQQLRQQQQAMLSDRLQRDLLDQTDRYTDLADMTEALVRIAEARYREER